MDIENIFNNVIVGFLVIILVFAFVAVGMLISIYADWLQPIMSGVLLILAYYIGKYIREKRKK